MITSKEGKIWDALEAVRTSYKTRADFTKRGLSPSRLDKAIQMGFIKEDINPADFSIEYSLTESGKQELEKLNKKLKEVV
jgi:hypothetical protein